MTLKKSDIITLPHPDLRKKSQKVGVITPKIHQLVQDMQSATLDWEHSRKHEVGVALAAVQVDRLLRVIIVRHNVDDKQDKSFTAFINPTITKREGKVKEDFEGCLSIKDIYGKVPRYEKVKIKALNLKGEEFRVTANGFLARVFQHEVDHMNGITFIDHIKDNPQAFYKLQEDGKLTPLNYEKDIRNNHILW